MNDNNDDRYLKNHKSIEDEFFKFTDKENGLPIVVANYFDLIRVTNQSLSKRIKELEQTIKLNEDNFHKNNETIDYVIDTYQNIVQPYLSAIKIDNEQTKNTINNLNKELIEIKKSRRKGGSYSPFKDNEEAILSYLNDYMKLYKKPKQEVVIRELSAQINKEINLSTFKTWWKNYKNSKGISIFKIDDN